MRPARAADAGTAGSTSLKRLPSPTVESSSILPPSACASSRAIGSPSPVPWLSREMNGTKMRSRSSGWMPGPVSRTSIWTTPFGRRGAERDDAAVGRPAERVREQVRDHLQHAVAVGDDRRRVGILVELEVDLAAPRLLAEARVGALDEHADVDLLRVHREPVRVELRQVEHVADEPLEPDRLAGDDVERGPLELGVVEQPVADRVDVALDRGQRRAELVRDRHQELPLALLGRRQPRRHLVELLGQAADLVAAAAGRHAHGVVARARSPWPRSTAPAPAR